MPAPRRELSRRGVYFFEGGPCSLAGVGPRGACSSVRLTLDDDDTLARVDAEGRTLHL